MVRRRMSDVDQEQKRPSLTLRSGTLGLNRPSEPGQVKQSFSHGRSKTVAVEVRPKRRLIMPGQAPEPAKAEAAAPAATARGPLSAPSPAPSAPNETHNAPVTQTAGFKGITLSPGMWLIGGIALIAIIILVMLAGRKQQRREPLRA